MTFENVTVFWSVSGSILGAIPNEENSLRKQTLKSLSFISYRSLLTSARLHPIRSQGFAMRCPITESSAARLTRAIWGLQAIQ